MAQSTKVTKPMTVEEFLEWDSGDDFVWELIDGYPRLKFPPNPDFFGQAAPTDDHQVVAKNVAALVDVVLRRARRPCRSILGAGQKIGARRGRHRIPDVVVKCGSSVIDARDPILIVEVNSPSNRFTEVMERLEDYKSLPTVQEILILEQDTPRGILHRRSGEGWAMVSLDGLDDRLALESVGLATTLHEVYRDVLPEAAPAEG